MREQLENIFKQMFKVEEISDTASPETLESWDSYMHIELILEIESVFNVSVSTSEAVELTSFGKIIAYLKDKGIS